MTGRPLDLTGRAFGKLVAVSVAENTGKRSWVCVCKCKRSVVVPTSQLQACAALDGRGFRDASYVNKLAQS